MCRCKNDVNKCVNRDFIVCDLSTIDDIAEAVNRFKHSKASSFDGIVQEHIVHAYPAILVQLQFTVPVLKVKIGDLTLTENY